MLKVKNLWYTIKKSADILVHMYGFDGIWSDNYFWGEPIERAEVELRVGKLKNRKPACKNEITGEMIKGGGGRQDMEAL